MRNVYKEYPIPFYMTVLADAIAITCFTLANIATLYFISDGFAQGEISTVLQHFINRYFQL